MELKETDQQDQTEASMFSNDYKNSPWNILPSNNEEPEEQSNTTTEAAIQTIDIYQKETIIYTDGSCKDGTENGGARN